MLEPGVWLSSGNGDPPRVTKKENAKQFATSRDARAALIAARQFRPFSNAIIEPIKGDA